MAKDRSAILCSHYNTVIPSVVRQKVTRVSWSVFV